MSKRKSSKAQSHLKGHQSVQRDGQGQWFDPSGARHRQNSAWGSPWWSLKRPSIEKASRTLNFAGEAARLRPFDPPSVEEVKSFSVDLKPTI